MGAEEMSGQEEARRERMRQIADEQAARPQDQQGPEWVRGVCTGCHADDLVKGPPGSELCTYCDQLRIMPPAPARPAAPVRLKRGRPPVLPLAAVFCVFAYVASGVQDMLYIALLLTVLAMATGR